MIKGKNNTFGSNSKNSDRSRSRNIRIDIKTPELGGSHATSNTLSHQMRKKSTLLDEVPTIIISLEQDSDQQTENKNLTRPGSTDITAKP